MIAGTITGSVAILTEAVHSSIDLVASIVAFFSVRKADEPADESHRYGHEKIENLAAAIEGILILVGSAAIAFEADPPPGQPRARAHGRARHRRRRRSRWCVNLVVSTCICRAPPSATDSPALEGDAAHLRTDALTSAAVLVGLVLVELTGAQWIDPVVALVVAASIVVTGRAAADPVLPRARRRGAAGRRGRGDPERDRGVRARAGVVGYHELRTRRAGARRYVDLHVQFRAGTSLEDAHRTAHELQDLIGARLRGADVLIHLEPEDRVRPGEVLVDPRPSRRSAPRSRRSEVRG